MFHNYFFLKRLANTLNEKLSSSHLIACFSQNKDELIFTFDTSKGVFIIQANLYPDISLIAFPKIYQRARKNSVDLFHEFIGLAVKNVAVAEYDRSFFIYFENNQQLVFKMHGRWSNILAFKDKQCTHIFRQSLTKDRTLSIDDFWKPITFCKEEFFAHHGNPFLMMPILGSEVKTYLELNHFDLLNIEKKWDMFVDMLEKTEKNPIYIHKKPYPHIHLLLSSTDSTHDPIEAANWIFYQKTHVTYFANQKKQALQSINQNINRAENYIQKTQEKLEKLQKTRKPEEIANIIMANLSNIQKGTTNVTLNDFYSNTNIAVRLKSNLSPQENAAIYYRKSKNRHKELNALTDNIVTKKKMLENLYLQKEELMAITEYKELKNFIKNTLKSENQKSKKTTVPYKIFTNGPWQLLVGKNAKSNDQLTFKIAKKDDLWLHAKDIAGSHAVLKQISGKNFSKNVIEWGASITAFHSKRKTDSVCPVIYTLRKYVRKTNKMLPGQVIVEKEKIVLVKPSIDNEG